MRLRVDVNGEEREFSLHLPAGWLLAATMQASGLPVVVLLHGSAGSIDNFREQWPFHRLAARPAAPNDDRFAVLVLQGSGYDDEHRGWNHGFGGPRLADDVAFLHAALHEAERRMKFALQRVVAWPGPALDPLRRYLFGYSMGGGMVYHASTDASLDLAAIWVFAGAPGGRDAAGVPPTVVNLPLTPTLLSLTHHHGLADDVVDPSGNPLAVSQGAARKLEAEGFTLAEAAYWASAVLDVGDGVEELVQRWGLISFPSTQSLPGWTAGAPRIEVTWTPVGAANPEARLVLDPTLGHIGFTSPGLGQNQYFRVGDVWEWFKDHPRA